MTILQKHLIFIPLCLVVFLGLFGGLVMMLWNGVVAEVFALPSLSYWQAVGLLLLCKILFGGFASGHHGHGHGHCTKNKLRQHWEKMTPEERERFIEARHDINSASRSQSDGK